MFLFCHCKIFSLPLWLLNLNNWRHRLNLNPKSGLVFMFIFKSFYKLQTSLIIISKRFFLSHLRRKLEINRVRNITAHSWMSMFIFPSNFIKCINLSLLSICINMIIFFKMFSLSYFLCKCLNMMINFGIFEAVTPS